MQNEGIGAERAGKTSVSLQGEGKTAMLVAVGNGDSTQPVPVGVIAVADTSSPDRAKRSKR